MIAVASTVVSVTLVLLLTILQHTAAARREQQAAQAVEALLLAELHATLRRVLAWR